MYVRKYIRNKVELVTWVAYVKFGSRNLVAENFVVCFLRFRGNTATNSANVHLAKNTRLDDNSKTFFSFLISPKDVGEEALITTVVILNKIFRIS